MGFGLIKSLAGVIEVCLRIGDLPRMGDRETERLRERERERELLPSRRLRRDLGGGERLLERDGDLLRLRGAGDGDRESDDEYDLLRRRSGLSRLPLPPRPR